MPPASRQRRGKAAKKRGNVVAAIRGRILSGALQPGARLPTQFDLLAEFRVSSVTVQSALHRLTADGFIEPRGRHGTFVAERPPHLNNYALVFDSHPADPP